MRFIQNHAPVSGNRESKIVKRGRNYQPSQRSGMMPHGSWFPATFFANGAACRLHEGDERMRVLVVDDVPIIADTLADMLAETGFEAFVAYDGESAIARAANLKPDLLISDITMNGLDGIDTALRVRALMPACKVLLCSGQANALTLFQRSRVEEHCLEVLPKPIHPRSLLTRIHALTSGAEEQTPRGMAV
jgi:CheY-like chemotaxis protein